MTISDVCTTALTYYSGLGLTPGVNAGIVAVLYYGESKLQTGPQSGNTGGVLAPAAVGVASWNGPRQAALANFAKHYGLNWQDLTTQLHFVLTESFNSYPKMKAAIQNKATTYADMINIMVDTYEIPANKVAEISTAMAGAADLFTVASTITSAAPTPIVLPMPTVAPVSVTQATPPALITQIANLEPEVLVALENPQTQATIATLLQIVLLVLAK